jgi:hypothetical protein
MDGPCTRYRAASAAACRTSTATDDDVDTTIRQLGGDQLFERHPAVNPSGGYRSNRPRVLRDPGGSAGAWYVRRASTCSTTATRAKARSRRLNYYIGLGERLVGAPTRHDSLDGPPRRRQRARRMPLFRCMRRAYRERGSGRPALRSVTLHPPVAEHPACCGRLVRHAVVGPSSFSHRDRKGGRAAPIPHWSQAVGRSTPPIIEESGSTRAAAGRERPVRRRLAGVSPPVLTPRSRRP